jgi:hypothetical protein
MSIKKTKTYEVLVEEGAPFIAGFTRALMGYSDYNGSIIGRIRLRQVHRYLC